METLRIHAQPILTAKSKHLGGAARLFYLFKNLDTAGAGWLEEKTLKAAAVSMGISRGSFYRWLADAKGAEFFRYVYDGAGDRHLLFSASYAELYTLLEIPYIDRQAVNVPAAGLFSEGWAAIVWEAWNAANVNCKVISQDTKQKLSGVPVATQRRLDRTAKIQRIRNYVITETPAAQVHDYQEFTGRRGVFTIGDKVAFPIPSMSVVNLDRVQPVGSRRLHRRSAFVRSCFPAEAGDVEARRIFCMSDKQTDIARRKGGGEAYTFAKNYEGFNVWKPVQ